MVRVLRSVSRKEGGERRADGVQQAGWDELERYGTGGGVLQGAGSWRWRAGGGAAVGFLVYRRGKRT